jgi:hypothetical protein
LKRQQIIKPCRAQLDRAAWNAIGTVFNTFWRRLAPVFWIYVGSSCRSRRFARPESPVGAVSACNAFMEEK